MLTSRDGVKYLIECNYIPNTQHYIVLYNKLNGEIRQKLNETQEHSYNILSDGFISDIKFRECKASNYPTGAGPDFTKSVYIILNKDMHKPLTDEMLLEDFIADNICLNWLLEQKPFDFTDYM